MKKVIAILLACNVLPLFGASSSGTGPETGSIKSLTELCHETIIKHTCGRKLAPKALSLKVQQITRCVQNTLKPKEIFPTSVPLIGTNQFQAFAVSDDKRLFTLASFGSKYKRIDDVIRVYDLQNKKEVGQCKSEDYIAFDTMFLSHDQTILFAIQKALTESPSRLCLFDAKNYTNLTDIELSFRPIGSSSNIALSHDDRTIYEAVDDIIRKVDIWSGVETEKTTFPENIIDISVSKDDKHLFVGCSDKVIECDAHSLEQLRIIKLKTELPGLSGQLKRLAHCNNTLFTTIGYLCHIKELRARQKKPFYQTRSIDLASGEKKQITRNPRMRFIKHKNMLGWVIAFQDAGKIQVFDHKNKLRLELTDTGQLINASDTYLLFKKNDRFSLLDINLAAKAIVFLTMIDRAKHEVKE